MRLKIRPRKGRILSLQFTGKHDLLCQCQLRFALPGISASLIAPSDLCQAYLPYGQEGVLVQAIKVEEATGLLASRYAPERYQKFALE